MTVLPPGVSASRFRRYVDALAQVVGQDWVFTSDEDVLTYRDAYTPFKGEPEEYIPSGAVAPDSVDQVQRIVRLANEYSVPLWPISTGKNLGYGGSAPRLSGTMILDLKRMNKVLEVNEPLAYALVEPGVSYFDFYRHLRDNNHKVWLDCPDPGWGSLIGNAMDHGLGRTPFRDHFGSHCGMEVVLPNGELLRTGLGAIPNSRGWQTNPYGFGPHVSPMFGQANFGIVTKMGFWLLPEPEATRSGRIFVPKFEDIHPFLDVMGTLIAERVVDCSWDLSSPLFSSRDAQVQAAVDRYGGDPSAELNQLGVERQLAYWSTEVRYYGAPELIDAKWEYTKRRLSHAIPDVRFRSEQYFHFPDDRDKLRDTFEGDLTMRAGHGIPSMSVFALGANRSSGHIFFSPIIPLSGTEVLRARSAFRKAFEVRGLPWRAPGVGGTHWLGRTLVLLYGFNLSDDQAHNKKVREDVRYLIKVAGDNGWGEYRTPPVFMDDVMDVYSFNNHSFLRFAESLKDALDPNGIVAPGRSGIWPKRFRTNKGRVGA